MDILNLSVLQAISKAKADVQGFSKEIVHWVSQIAAAFRHDHGGRFTLQTWNDLAEMRYV